MKKQQWKLLFDIFISFFKIGCFTFGGGYAMIPLIQREFVDNKGWVEEEEIIDIFAVAQTIPGAIAINSSSFVGYKIAKRRGAIIATLGVVLPSFLIITCIATIFTKFQNYPLTIAVFKGVRPAIVALILDAAIKVGKVSLKDKVGIIITIVAMILVFVIKINVIFVIILGGIIGIIVSTLFNINSNYTSKTRSEKVDLH